MKAKLFLFLLIVLSFSGCRKLINIDPNYVGEWRGGYYGSTFYSLSITEDGGAEYERIMSGGRGTYGHEHWHGPLKSNGRRFQIAYSSPWFIVIENPVLTNDDCRGLFNPYGLDSTYRYNNWRIKFKYPKTIGYDGAEVVMYRHQF